MQVLANRTSKNRNEMFMFSSRQASKPTQLKNKQG